MSQPLPASGRRRRRLSCTIVLFALCACSSSGHSGSGSAASATIGPEGGTLSVDTGRLLGVQLTVPPGALDAPVTFTVFEEPLPVDSGVGQPVLAATPGVPFRIEPRELVMADKARLRLPFHPGRVYETGPGNVRARQDNPWATVEWQPDVVDLTTGHVEIETLTLGRFEVVRGPIANSVADYVADTPEPVQLQYGYAFSIGDVDASSPYAAAGGKAWSISGPGLEERLIVVGSELVARESDTPSWREVWQTPLDLFQSAQEALAATFSTSLATQMPIGQQSSGGLMFALGYRQYAPPREVLGETQYDVLRIVLDCSWNRGDIGVGQRNLTIWFSPQRGPLALMLDGQVLERVQ